MKIEINRTKGCYSCRYIYANYFGKKKCALDGNIEISTKANKKESWGKNPNFDPDYAHELCLLKNEEDCIKRLAAELRENFARYMFYNLVDNQQFWSDMAEKFIAVFEGKGGETDESL